MPSASHRQRKAAAAALRAKRGQMDPRKLGKASRHMYESMTEEQLAEFAASVK